MIENPIKVVVCGPAGAGKTTLIRAVSTTPVVDTDEVSTESGIGEQTTVAMDFGTVEHASATICLFGTPGQERFSYMWDILCDGATGLIGLVAGDRPADFSRARGIFEHVTSQVPIPWVLGVTRADREDVWASEDVAAFFGVPPSSVLSVDARDPSAGLRLLSRLFDRIAAGQGLSADAPEWQRDGRSP